MKTISKVLIGVALTSSVLAGCMGGYYYVSARPAEPRLYTTGSALCRRSLGSC